MRIDYLLDFQWDMAQRQDVTVSPDRARLRLGAQRPARTCPA